MSDDTLKRQPAHKGIGASLKRKEDDRFLRDRGEYVANLRMVGMLDVAFARSPLAHARIKGIEKPPGLEEAVFTLAELVGVKPIIADSALPGFKSLAQPVLAGDKDEHYYDIAAYATCDGRLLAVDCEEIVDSGAYSSYPFSACPSKPPILPFA